MRYGQHIMKLWRFLAIVSYHSSVCVRVKGTLHVVWILLAVPNGQICSDLLLRTDVYRAAPTCGLAGALSRCWGEDVLLTALTHRFVRPSLQLLARYATWVRTGLTGEWTVDDGGSTEGIFLGFPEVANMAYIASIALPHDRRWMNEKGGWNN